MSMLRTSTGRLPKLTAMKVRVSETAERPSACLGSSVHSSSLVWVKPKWEALTSKARASTRRPLSLNTRSPLPPSPRIVTVCSSVRLFLTNRVVETDCCVRGTNRIGPSRASEWAGTTVPSVAAAGRRNEAEELLSESLDPRSHFTSCTCTGWSAGLCTDTDCSSLVPIWVKAKSMVSLRTMEGLDREARTLSEQPIATSVLRVRMARTSTAPRRTSSSQSWSRRCMALTSSSVSGSPGPDSLEPSSDVIADPSSVVI
mmetsp:Transcript_11308/g.25715  ORF Transcript_11308/g.25715 Transcript_11308/m.25715 type:complete len:258 (-) Transcript_11308:2219-2992(-)